MLFNPAAAVTDERKGHGGRVQAELLRMGFSSENIIAYYLNGKITEKEAMEHDMVYFTV